MMDEEQMDFEVLPELTPEQQKQIEAEHEARLRIFYSSTHGYSLQKWYHPLAKFTFASFSFPLTKIEAYLLASLYQEDDKALKRPQIQSAKNSLIKKVDDFLQKHFSSGCFMKLSTRSPKDVGWRYQDESQANYHVQRLVNLLKETTKLDRKSINKVYRYFLEQSKDKLKISKGEDFIKVFAQSQRIQIDLNDLAFLNNRAFVKLGAYDYSAGDQKLIDVWGRQWVDCQWMQEFRCFYHDYELTAISQYDQRCFFEELNGKQQLICSKIKHFFEQIKPKLKQINLSQGVMDLIVKLNNLDPVILIQINVFDHNSRASLFNWEKDIKILKNGPLEFRFLKEQIDISKYELVKMMGMVEKGIQSVIQKAMQRLNLQIQWMQLQ